MPRTQNYIKRPLIPTELGAKCLRARLSLRETQTEFAKRFHVTKMTVQHWESGKTIRIQQVHKLILEAIVFNLKRDGHYLPEEVMTTVFREEVEKKGNALV